MTKPSRLILGAVLTLALAIPEFVWAQAVPRGSGSSGGGSSSSGGGSSSSGGGSSGGGSSSGSGGSGSSGSTYSPPPLPPPSVRTPPPQRSGSGGQRTGTAVPRGSSSSGGSTSSTGPAGSSGVSGDSSGRSNPNTGVDPRSRDRNGRPIAGAAVPRQPGTGDLGYLASRWYPWYNSSYPWYGSSYPRYGLGLNWYYGYGSPIFSPFVSYNPLFYSRWMWGRYGMWYDPYDPFGYYDPFYLDPYYGGYGYGGGSGGFSSSFDYPSSPEGAPVEATGSVRIRVKPSDAKVYVDGTLVGVVDEFDGLTSHLAATVGRHEIEVRADGYEPLKMIVNVEEDKTVTARGSLRKK